MINNNLIITACILSLASNQQADAHLQNCRQALSIFGELIVSPILINECQKKSDVAIPIYHNQIAMLDFTQPIFYQQFLSFTKQLEQDNGRGEFAKPLVTLDIDILVIQVEKNSQLAFDKTFTQLEDNWWAVTRRLPLADYDKQGLEVLLIKNQSSLPSISNFFMR